MQNLEIIKKDSINKIDALKEEFSYTNVMQVPR